MLAFKAFHCFPSFLRRRSCDVRVLGLCEAVSLEIGLSFRLAKMTCEMSSLLALTYFPR